MIRVTDSSGVAVAVEVWSVPAAGLAGILLNEPPGLSIGKGSPRGRLDRARSDR